MRRQLTTTLVVSVTAALLSLMPIDRTWGENAVADQSPLEIAVAEYKTQLQARGKSEYAGLLSASQVQKAIRTGIQSYETLLEREGEKYDGIGAHFDDHCKQTYLAIANDGIWPDGVRFDAFFSLTDERGIRYDGIGLRLHMDTPDAKYAGFAMPIVDVFFGRFQGSGQKKVEPE